MYKWRKIDKIMDKKYGKPEGLNKTILVITIVLIGLAIGRLSVRLIYSVTFLPLKLNMDWLYFLTSLIAQRLTEALT